LVKKEISSALREVKGEGETKGLENRRHESVKKSGAGRKLKQTERLTWDKTYPVVEKIRRITKEQNVLEKETKRTSQLGLQHNRRRASTGKANHSGVGPDWVAIFGVKGRGSTWFLRGTLKLKNFLLWSWEG